jgi:hypothetical protein
MIRERIIRPQKSSFRQSESDGQEGSCHFSNESESYYHEAATGFEKWRVQVSYRAYSCRIFFRYFVAEPPQSSQTPSVFLVPWSSCLLAGGIMAVTNQRGGEQE